MSSKMRKSSHLFVKEWEDDYKTRLLESRKKKHDVRQLATECNELAALHVKVQEQSARNLEVKLEERLHELEFWRQELDVAVEQLQLGTKVLEDVIPMLFAEVRKCEDQRALALYRQKLRSERPTTENVLDDPRSALMVEFDLADAEVRNLKFAVSESQEKIRMGKKLAYLVDKLLATRQETENVDKLCKELRTDSSALAALNSHGEFESLLSTRSWIVWNQSLAEAAKRHAQLLRLMKDHWLAEIARIGEARRSALRDTELFLDARIKEIRVAKDQIMTEHSQLVGEVTRAEHGAETLRKSLVDLEKMKKLTVGRLALRSHRPRHELTHDGVLDALKIELLQVNSLIAKEQELLAKHERKLSGLRQEIQLLEEQVRDKGDALAIEESVVFFTFNLLKSSACQPLMNFHAVEASKVEVQSKLISQVIFIPGLKPRNVFPVATMKDLKSISSFLQKITVKNISVESQKVSRWLTIDIREIVVNCGGIIRLSNFQNAFFRRFGKYVNVKHEGFQNLEMLIEAIPDLTVYKDVIYIISVGAAPEAKKRCRRHQQQPSKGEIENGGFFLNKEAEEDIDLVIKRLTEIIKVGVLLTERQVANRYFKLYKSTVPGDFVGLLPAQVGSCRASANPKNWIVDYVKMTEESFAYGSVSREGTTADPEKPPEEISDESIVVKIEAIRQHRGHVRTGSSVEDHPPLYAKDSAYLISERSPSRQRQLLAENCNLVIVAVTLCFLGVGLVVTGIFVESLSLEHLRSFVFYIAGAICLIPGVYHMVYIFCALRGKQGYNLANLPVFNWT
ncbi:unnamed protein product [Notodromas monacha]|uniref:Tektin-1 n=1 Tax=Notodromas monacha TaxID=399045 RepID=A0A7R9BT72_9CRUS|nr:unnamed protein product [Notodromas monacha]CAG0919850.1 unnamed protein product [Notodromas monacha]